VTPATINWSNYEFPSPYIDSDIEINGTTYAGGAASGTFTVPGGSTVVSNQKSGTSSGQIGLYRLTVTNNTNSITLYNTTITQTVSSYVTIQTYSFDAEPGKTYTIAASSDVTYLQNCMGYSATSCAAACTDYNGCLT
jgi:hypothetical protein